MALILSQANPTHKLTSYFSNIHVFLFSHLSLGLPTKVCAILFPLMLSTCPAHLILFDFFILLQ
jgi:hypothetical protein